MARTQVLPSAKKELRESLGDLVADFQARGGQVQTIRTGARAVSRSDMKMALRGELDLRGDRPALEA